MSAIILTENQKTYLQLTLIVALFALSIFEPAFAADPFAAAEDKGNELLEFLSGNFAIIATAIVLCIVGFCLFKGWIQAGWAISIATGATIIGSSVQIATWMIK